MITKTEYRVISPANKKIDRNEIEVEVTETFVQKRTVSLGSLDSAIDLLKGTVVRYNKNVEENEKDIKSIEKERSEIDNLIKKSIKK